jgi:hypothetical protein
MRGVERRNGEERSHDAERGREERDVVAGEIRGRSALLQQCKKGGRGRVKQAVNVSDVNMKGA